MKRRHGFSLIETMVAVAILGILLVTAYGGVAAQRLESARLVQRERALQALEFEAEGILRRLPTDPQVRTLHLAELPEAQFEARQVQPDVVSLTLAWLAPGRQHARVELMLVGRLP